MKIVTVRRISQVFFLLVFLWFCGVTTFGVEWWQLRGWPVNLFLQLDPLVAIGTMLSTHTLYASLALALLTVVLTIIFGRFFCSWVCPFGSVHHFVGFLGRRKKSVREKIELNKYRKAAGIKYLVLIVFLVMAGLGSLQTGLLDPISLMTRSVNLVILPIADRFAEVVFVSERFYEGAWVILSIFFSAILLNLVIPRFYCRFVCPLGALFGVLGRFAIWRIGKKTSPCTMCGACEKNCEGGCHPSQRVRIAECVLCLNCVGDCKDEFVKYGIKKSACGEETSPDISRRGFMLSLAGGAFAVPAIRLGGKLAGNWSAGIIRPPGSVDEGEFLKRCIKCGQCMRICPTNVIQPASIAGGVENLWTPALNNRIGTSGCQLNCVACGHICPTSAIRPISFEEKVGVGEFAEFGPIRIGTAFVDRGRCLPWAMGKPCIVCQENCPVSPKAIYTREVFETVRDGEKVVKRVDGTVVELTAGGLEPDKFATGDYYCDVSDGQRRKIAASGENSITISAERPFEGIPAAGAEIKIQIRLQRPYIDIEKCTGCGVCEHECPVSGKRAVRVTAEGETRSVDRKLLL